MKLTNIYLSMCLVLFSLSASSQSFTNQLAENVLFKGIYNPISLELDSLESHQLILNDEMIELDSVCRCFQIPVLSHSQKDSMEMYLLKSNIVIDTLNFLAMDLPGLSVKIEGKTSSDGVIFRTLLLKAEGLELDVPFGMEGFEIRSYRVVVSIGEQIRECAQTGATLNKQTKMLLERLKRGQYITFEQIKVSTPTNELISLGSITLRAI